jgi:hypothetical protein
VCQRAPVVIAEGPRAPDDRPARRALEGQHANRRRYRAFLLREDLPPLPPSLPRGLRHVRSVSASEPGTTALDEMTDAIAHAILTFAMTSSAVQGTDKGSDKAAKYDPTFRGSHAIK